MNSSLETYLQDLQELARECSTLVTAWVTEDGSLKPILRLQLEEDQSTITIIPTRAAKALFPRILRNAVADEPYLVEEAQPEVVAALLGISSQPGESLIKLFQRSQESSLQGKFAVGKSIRGLEDFLRQPGSGELLLLNPDGNVDPELIASAREDQNLVPVLQTEAGYHQVLLRQAPVGVPDAALAIEHSIQQALCEEGIPVSNTYLATDSRGVATLIEERTDRQPMASLSTATKRQIMAGPVSHTLNESLSIALDGADIHLSDSAAAARIINGFKEPGIRKSLVTAIYVFRMLGNIDLSGDYFSLNFGSSNNGKHKTSLAPLRAAGSYGLFQTPSSSLKSANLLGGDAPLRISQRKLMKSLKSLRAYDLDFPSDSREAFAAAKTVLVRSADVMAQIERDGQIEEGQSVGYRMMLNRPLTGAEGWNQSLGSIAKSHSQVMQDHNQSMVF